MPTFAEETIAALHALFAKLETLQQINIRYILLPEVYTQYERTLQEAYNALTNVEDALTALGMKLEYQHYRLSSTVDELPDLCIHSETFHSVNADHATLEGVSLAEKY